LYVPLSQYCDLTSSISKNKKEDAFTVILINLEIENVHAREFF